MPVFGAFRHTHSTQNVTSTGVSTVLAANPNRKHAWFACASTAQQVWLGLSTQTVAVGLGIGLNPATATGGVGEAYEMSAARGNLYIGAVTAIASATTSVGLVITESV